MVILSPPITTEDAAQGFAAIGSPARLQVLQDLVRAGNNGLMIGEIQNKSQMPASTLAHHLRILTSAKLVTQKKSGRSVANHAAYDHLKALAAYILKECCVDELSNQKENL